MIDFDKLELKVAEVIDCKPVEGADKLLQFRLDAGDAGGHRQNFIWYRSMVSKSRRVLSVKK